MNQQGRTMPQSVAEIHSERPHGPPQQQKPQSVNAVPAVLQASVSGRVRNVINTFEAASLSSNTRHMNATQQHQQQQQRPPAYHYHQHAHPRAAVVSPPPPSPIKATVPTPASYRQLDPAKSSNHGTSPISPTVPASFFQQQRAKRTPPASPAAARVQQHQQQHVTPRSDKENWSMAHAGRSVAGADSPRSSSYPSPSAFPAPPTSRPLGPAMTSATRGEAVLRESRSKSTEHEEHDEAQVQAQVQQRARAANAESTTSVETMATRSSNSTHAQSLITVVNPDHRIPASTNTALHHEAQRRRSGQPSREFSGGRQISVSNARESAKVQSEYHGAGTNTSPPLIPMMSFEAREHRQQDRQEQQQQHELGRRAGIAAHHTTQDPARHGATTSSDRMVKCVGVSDSQSGSSPPERPRSAFSEALPASFGSSASPAEMRNATGGKTHDGFERLPPSQDQLAPEHRAKEGAAGAERTARRGRPRASTIGGATTRPTVEVQESFEERERRINEAFGRLLDTMQLPDATVRAKMLGLALPLKEEMLRSASSSGASAASPTLTAPKRPTHSRGRSLNITEANTSPILRAPVAIDTGTGKKEGASHGTIIKASFLRKAKSTNSLRAASATQASSSSTATTVAATGSPDEQKRRRRPSGSSHGRTTSASSLFRSFGRATAAAPSSSLSSTAKSKGRDQSAVVDNEDALYWAVRIRSAGCAVLEVKEVGRLRGRLRAEPPSWVRDFLRHGGYQGLLERLKELLEVEWREEQHDDQILYEVLRCIKALSLTVCGSRALASRCPTPFLPLAALLFSEKRPGDLPCRQLLIEIVQALFDVCPEAAEPIERTSAAWTAGSIVQVEVDSSVRSSDSGNGSSGGVRRYIRKMKGGADEEDDDAAGGAGLPGQDEREPIEVISTERRRKAHVLVHSLMQGPVSEKDEARLDFIQSAHRPRKFKLWVTEMSDIVRDYFWIFCHSQNLFWSLHQLDVNEIEAPKVPSGMTGGVEYEAMCYAAAHFRLINAVARTCASVEEAFTFHNDLFESGLERVLLTLRRASLVYYQQLHLEMSRYLALARAARFNLGPRILSCLDARTLSPEERMVVEMAQSRQPVVAAPSGAPQLGNIAFN